MPHRQLAPLRHSVFQLLQRSLGAPAARVWVATPGLSGRAGSQESRAARQPATRLQLRMPASACSPMTRIAGPRQLHRAAAWQAICITLQLVKFVRKFQNHLVPPPHLESKYSRK